MIPLLILSLFLRPPISFRPTGKQGTFTQILDHFSMSDNRRFQQRYFINDIYYRNISSDPIIVDIGGESEYSESSIARGPYKAIASQTHALIAGLEHRFFGKSQPFSDLSAESLKYNTVDQALADIAHFITFLRNKYCYNSTCDVLVIGGSYSGALSSWFRLYYPHLANYSWSSSAPINIKKKFYEYDASIATTLRSFNESCFVNTKLILSSYHKVVESGDQNKIKELRTKFSIPESIDITSVLSILSDVISYAVQYNKNYQIIPGYCVKQSMGNKDKKNPIFNPPQILTKDDKNFLEETNSTNTVPKQIGTSNNHMDININMNMNQNDNSLGESFDFSDFGEPDESAFIELYTNVLKILKISVDSLDPFSYKDESIDGPNAAMRSWTWMQCNELGWFSTSAGFKSSFVNFTYYDRMCAELYGNMTIGNISSVSRRYGGANPRSSYVVFTQGTADPWSTMGVQSIESSNSQHLLYIKDGSHCEDLHSDSPDDSPDLTRVRRKVETILIEWLSNKCMKQCNKGMCLHDRCLCDDGWSGEFCTFQVVTSVRFWEIGITALMVPLIIMISIGGTAWWLFRRMQEEQFLLSLHY
ncbi:hypothetical protein TRFO_09660 [Tritrichomonas foetus]|uniref:Clan SC, family S28, unassigned serine peptidase n=1 Tax=Tritrichomonas foetus TaxID=1144522 RepID=A0A1J4JDC6_9EUKA|nr:hypothetical protein TRFO_09660 [Tritrichomonas foetus]|eukprot:OHS97096.1 hypothetical protein TRFO_09660 [Tritrichomonas foetus]